MPLLALAAIAWFLGVLAGPFLPAAVAGPLYACASLICHQISERSFHIGGAQLPVCARCIGIYGGLASGVVVAWLRWTPATARPNAAWSTRHARYLAAVGAAPTLVMVAGEWAGLWETSNVARAIAGAPLGIVVGLVVLAALDISSGEP